MGSQGKWSTQKVEEILKSYDQTGSLPKNNPFYENQIDWRAANLNYDYTYDELLEQSKIETNIIYFAEKYAHVMTDEGIRKVKLRHYQKKVLNQFKTFKNNVYMASRQTGKCVTFDTKVKIFDKANNKIIEVPIFEIHYMFKKKLTFLDKVEYMLFKFLYSIKQFRPE